MEKIGEHIKEVLLSQHHSAKWLADQIPCERTNVYDIFKRTDINVNLLQRLCVILDFDFFICNIYPFVLIFVKFYIYKDNYINYGLRRN